MSTKDFFDLSMFSFGIIILNFMSKIQDVFMQSYNHNINETFFYKFKKIADVIRYKIIYIMIYMYQIVAIWYPEAR